MFRIITISLSFLKIAPTLTIKEFAKILNISAATVSKALNDSHEISTATKARVLAMASELNFEPNPHASSLRKNKNKTIAVVIPEISNNFFSKAIDGIEMIAQEKGYHTLIYLTHENYKKEVGVLKHLLNGRVDGVLASMTLETTDFTYFNELLEKNLPLVLFDRVSDQVDTAKISTDDYHAGYIGTKHLLDTGCKKIGFLAFSQYAYACLRRKKGYMDALKEYNIEFDESLIVNCTYDAVSNFSLINNILKKRKKVDGIFSSAENLAILTYQICSELAIQIPKDIRLVSFSNMPLASYLNPSMTTITQPAFEMGKEAALTLFKILEKPRMNYKDVFLEMKSNLFIRNSTKRY